MLVKIRFVTDYRVRDAEARMYRRGEVVDLGEASADRFVSSLCVAEIAPRDARLGLPAPPPLPPPEPPPPRPPAIDVDLDTLDPAQLKAYAAEHLDLELDGRWSTQRMREAIAIEQSPQDDPSEG